MRGMHAKTRQLLINFPSRDATAAVFLGGLAERFPTSAAVQEARGVAWVSAGDRDQALAAFRRAVELDEDNTWSRMALRHLDPDLASPRRRAGPGTKSPLLPGPQVRQATPCQ